RVFHLTSATKIKDGAGNPTTLSAATVGEDVGGSYMKDASGTMTLYSVRFGAKTGSATKDETSPEPSAAAASAPASAPAPAATPAPAAETSTPAPATETAAAPAKAKKQTFSGKVVSVDAANNTIVIH